MLPPDLFRTVAEPLLLLPLGDNMCHGIMIARVSDNLSSLTCYSSPNPYEAGSYQAGYSMPNVSQSLHPPYVT